MPRRVYDIFISHNRADKAWVRRLAAVLADKDYNGRGLRPWLDEHFLDPGALGSESELTTALDRSRVLGLVLSPEAVASGWVDFELRYFLESRAADDIVVMLRKDCVAPAALASHPVIDFRDEDIAEAPLKQLLLRLCPPTAHRQEEVRDAVDAAFDAVLAADDDGYGTAPERDAVFAALSRSDIDDAGGEGLAIAGFVQAAEIVRRTREVRFQVMAQVADGHQVVVDESKSGSSRSSPHSADVPQLAAPGQLPGEGCDRSGKARDDGE